MNITIVTAPRLNHDDLRIGDVWKYVGESESVFVKINTEQSIRLSDGERFAPGGRYSVLKAKAINVAF